MKLNATVEFTACGPYSKQHTFPAVYATGRMFDTQDFRNALDAPPDRYLEEAEFEGNFEDPRFRFKMTVRYGDEARGYDFCILYGHTSDGTELLGDTRLYFTRVLGLRSRPRHLPEMRREWYATKRYDILLMPKPQDRKYNASLPSVLRRLGAELAFQPYFVAGGRVENICSLAHQHGTSVAIEDITAEKYADHFNRILREVAHPQEMSVYADNSDLIAEMSDRAESVTFRHTRIFRTLSNETNWQENGYITLDDVYRLIEDGSKVLVDHRRINITPSESPSPFATRIFEDYARRMVVDASQRGLEELSAIWVHIDGEDEYTEHRASKIFAEAIWEDPLTDWDGDQLDMPIDGVLIKKVEPEDKPVRKPYGDVSFRLAMDVDLNGDILGTLSLHGKDHVMFVRPSFALAATSGMLVSENVVNDLGMAMKEAVTVTVR